MKCLIKSYLNIIFFCGLVAILAGCGSGGGGGSDEGGTKGLSYTGKTSKALITKDNAQEIMSNYYASYKGSSEAGFLGRQMPGPESQLNYLGVWYGIYSVFHRMESVTHNNGTNLPRPLNLKKMVDDPPQTIPGDCLTNPGEAVIRTQTDDKTGDFTRTITFNNYCTNGVTISGSANISGNSDGSYAKVTFSELYVSTGACSITMQGEMTLTIPDDSTVKMDMALLVRDNNIKKTYKIENFHLSATDYSSYTIIEESGRFYDPDYGYVDIDTTTPLKVYYSDDFPSSGVIEAIGDKGTKAKLTAVSNTQYRLEADTDGDGLYDYNSDLLLWEDMLDTAC